jgi:peptidoglycan/LPS O-acetylase OafA/YrhL
MGFGRQREGMSFFKTFWERRRNFGKPTRYPGLDGLRCVAIVYVIAFHFLSDSKTYGAFVKGGFCGVDLFFVLSGFLVTSILFKQQLEDSLDLKRFLLNRAYRLMPALYLMVAVVLTLCFVLFPWDFEKLGQDSVWVLTFMANWKRAFIDTLGDSKFYNHMWSLGVEAQFYLAWPLVLIATRSWRLRKRLTTMAALILFIYIYRMWLVVWNASYYRVYHGFDTRIDELLLGSMLAFVLFDKPSRDALSAFLKKHRYLSLLGLLLMPVVGALAPIFSRSLPLFGFPLIGLFAVVAVADCVLVPANPLSRLMSFKPFVYVGTISYGIYLWHLPVRVMLRDFSGDSLLLALVVSIAVADLSFHLVEKPMLENRRLS